MASPHSTFNGLILVSWLLMLFLALVSYDFVSCQEQLTVESRQQKDNDDLTATIKYLDQVDKYFSQLARPRFGRSDYKQPNYHLGQNLAASGGQFQAYSLADLINSRMASRFKDSAY